MRSNQRYSIQRRKEKRERKFVFQSVKLFLRFAKSVTGTVSRKITAFLHNRIHISHPVALILNYQATPRRQRDRKATYSAVTDQLTRLKLTVLTASPPAPPSTYCFSVANLERSDSTLTIPSSTRAGRTCYLPPSMLLAHNCPSDTKKNSLLIRSTLFIKKNILKGYQFPI